jgi:Flp pilus assembly protein TadB
MTARGRAALLAAAALLCFGLVVGCGLPALLALWDYGHEQAQFERFFPWALSIACAFVVSAVVLLAYAFVDWHSESRRRPE